MQHNHPQSRPHFRDRRGGAVIIVVLALLSLLIFLGVFFFEFAQEEQMASVNYATSPYAEIINPDELFDEAAKQLLVGPEVGARPMSALASHTAGVGFTAAAVAGLPYGIPGNVHCMLAHTIGRTYYVGANPVPTDIVPHNGHGIRSIPHDVNLNGVIDPWVDLNNNGFFNSNEGDYIAYDMNGDGIEDAVLYPMDATDYPAYSSVPLFAINFSRPAQVNPTRDAFSQPVPGGPSQYGPLAPFQPDVEYSYPDINNLFLAYDVTIGNRRILVPSFMRPDLLTPYRQYHSGNTSIYPGPRNIYRDAYTQRLVLRPHALNRYPDGTFRFLSAGIQAQSGERTRYIPPFQFEVDTDRDDNPLNRGVPNEMGLYTADITNYVAGTTPASLNETYELDVDVTGDGEPDSIWIDLGMDIVSMSDGRQFVPLFAFHVLDADSNINLNTAGNIQGLLVDGNAYNSGLPFSTSNTGASASEVNPLRALTGDPAQMATRTDLQLVQFQHAYNFGFTPAIVQAPLTMANIELYWLLAGRVDARRVSTGAGPIGPLSGRYGDESGVATFVSGSSTTAPGGPGDDDNDSNPNTGSKYEGGARKNAYSQYDPRGGYFTAPTAFGGHPVDPKGVGGSAYTATGRVTSTAGNSPVVWPVYNGSGWEARNPTTTPGGVPLIELPYPNGATDEFGNADPVGATLFPNTTPLTMINEEDEINLSVPNALQDDPFGPEESLRLQVATADAIRLGLATRVDRLAPFNFLYARNSERIRRLFTPASWDFTSTAYVPHRVEFDSATSRYVRRETADWFGDGERYFPPEFGPNSTPVPVYSANDPFRPELRTLLASRDTDPSAIINSLQILKNADLSNGAGTLPHTLWRQPLNLNKLLVGFGTEDANGNSTLDSGEDTNNNGVLDAVYPIYRQLMPHPHIRDSGTTLAGVDDMIHSHTAAIPGSSTLTLIDGTNSASCVAAMEWWARYDRQRLARDIYTLLYVVGAPQDMDPATPTIDTPMTHTYSPEVTREMAQFAVNYVDALDRDDVITKFEYDDNLSDGWNVVPTTARKVYGVERSSLTFSEVQFIQVAGVSGADNTTTLHKEERDVHQYLYIELRNGSPHTIPLDEQWRISRVVHTSGGQSTATIDVSLQFKRLNPTTYKSVPPGENFLISMHDGFVKDGSDLDVWSDFYVDVSGGGNLESVLPTGGPALANNTTPNNNPQADIDLGRTGVAAPFDFHNYYTLVNGTTNWMPTNKTLVKRIEAPAMASTATPEATSFDLVLERRQNLTGVDSQDDNEWIEVDRFHVDSRQMETGHPNPNLALFEVANDAQADVQTALSYLNSRERRQLFEPAQLPHSQSGAPVTSTATVHHSMTSSTPGKHAGNSVSPSPFTLWEPHFDRDLTSVYELNSVPLYGNWPLRVVSDPAAIADTGAPAANLFYKELHGGTQFNLAPNGQMSGDFTAGIRFKFPNGIPGKPYRGWNRFNYQNSWYRLFDLVTVPRRADQQNGTLGSLPGSLMPVSRTPGKINLNTLRDELVLAALIDNEQHLVYGNGTNDSITANRNWFLELLQSRDGDDAIAAKANLPGLPLPNSVTSRPFRGNAQWDPNWSASLDDQSIENGMLRSARRRGSTVLGTRPPGASYVSPTLTATSDYTTNLWGAGPTYDTSGETWQALFDAADRDATNLDHHTRDRILSKIANNSTNKSHVYYVWMAVGYFEAHTLASNGRTQIGARITDLPIHRKFMLVDMSRLEDAYSAADNTFDYRKFIQTEKRLR